MSEEEARESSLKMQPWWEVLGPDPRRARQVEFRNREKCLGDCCLHQDRLPGKAVSCLLFFF
ncbi:rCG50293 [Rattus norvegicus]|uniref:RCG50293 n=1 Tax=Rattus norvegicus TaxID=10116 RepID=A6JYY4_RAT|nr:rCG50293 [Rattus norvegicus]